ncbi:MAG TPA: ATP-binding protein, partial [Pyrinomonadaceae bacterium]|nr:ATP-binding protein [Pyrinomonadaceae bacterium]
DFIGRSSELDEILRHAKNESKSLGMLILSTPNNGLSELLRQTYDQLFYEQGDTIPVYFSFAKNDETAEETARRFLQTMLLQVVAFRRANVGLLDSSPDVCELSELALPSDGHWIDRLVLACEIKSPLKDERSFVKQAFSAPLRAKSHGVNIFLMLDSFENVENPSNSLNLLDEIKEIYQRATIPFAFAGHRRFILSAMQGGDTRLQNIEILKLNPLVNPDAGLLVENLSEKLQVKINEQTRDLIVQQFGANPQLISTIFNSAQDYGKNLASFNQVEQVYVDSLLGGRIAKIYDTIFDEIAPNFTTQKRILKLLANQEEKSLIETWAKYLELSEAEFHRILQSLRIHEIIPLKSGTIHFAKENEVLRDYVETRYELEVIGEARVLVVGRMLASALKRAPHTMTRFYRNASAIGLRELLAVFDCQSVPGVLFNYADFKKTYKGEETAVITKSLENESEMVSLPQIVFTANCQAYYPPISQLTMENSSAVAIGFDKGNYTDENEVVWISAEIDSKLEVTRELTEFWCDRLEMVALMCNFINYKICLIALEGFSPEACEVLQDCRAFGSSRRQVEFLVKYLKAEGLVKQRLKANEYEMVVPMGDDTEMIAAHAIEDIARRHDFQPRAINQIKTALVEACINAAEHSHSPDRKIYQKFTVEEDKLIITISNRGVKLPVNKIEKSVENIEPSEGRRGWGLKLMRKLMDEVTFEQVDDGTRISMVKYLKK